MSVATKSVLGMRVDAASCEEAARLVLGWARNRRSASVCAANVHMAMETFDSAAFRGSVNGADLVVPDGKPLVWALSLLGAKTIRIHTYKTCQCSSGIAEQFFLLFGIRVTLLP